MTPATDRPAVLVIDDEPVIVEALRRVLSSGGFEVTTAPDAETGLELLETGRPGLVVVDLKLPGLSGLELLQRAAGPGRTFVLMSGYATSENIVESLQGGAFGFLSKPFTFEEARSLVHRAAKYLALPPEVRVPHPPGAGVSGYLGVQSWVRMRADGTALVGVSDVFGRTTGMITSVDLPTVAFPLVQGDVLVRVVGDNGWPYVSWTPIAGQVLETNALLAERASLLVDDPYGDGWIARMQPLDAPDDLGRLTPAR